jgi:hypothetical protein
LGPCDQDKTGKERTQRFDELFDIRSKTDSVKIG